MKTGYLVLETHPDHAGMIRARISDELPNTQESEAGSEIRYIARFDDIEAALMHLQNQLHNRLVDLDSRLYKTEVSHAISVVESDDLRHQQVWIDPSLDPQTRTAIDAETAQLKRRHALWNRTWTIVGGFFVLLFIVLNLITGS
jgi:ABC-type phosphate transport system auxiliary subunit